MRRIEEDSKREGEEVVSKARERAEEIIRQARNEAQSILNSSTEKARGEAELVRKEKISSATLGARSALERAIDEAENRYIRALKLRIEKFRSSEEYYSFVQKKIEEAWKILGPGSIAYLGEKDARKLKENGLQLNILKRDIDSLGGAVVTSADGKLSIDLTFSEILRSKEEEILRTGREAIR